jgi:hypothetical protein
VSIKNDWSFEATNLWGPRLFRFTTLPDGWMLKSIILNSQDVTDAAVDFQRGQDVDGLQEFLESLRGRATRFSLGEGQRKTLDLKIIRTEGASRPRP